MKSPSKQVMDGRMVVGSQVHLKIIVNILRELCYVNIIIDVHKITKQKLTQKIYIYSYIYDQHKCCIHLVATSVLKLV